jgi:hypothetical protein
MTYHSPEPTGNLPSILPPYLPLYPACCPPAQSPGGEKREPDNPLTTATGPRMIVAYRSAFFKVSSAGVDVRSNVVN